MTGENSCRNKKELEPTCLNCRALQLYKTCQGKPWYSYNSITFCPHQVVWLIEHLPALERGEWPANPLGESDIDMVTKTQLKSEAYYTKACELAAEINKRLACCGIDGKLCRAEVQNTSFSVYSEETNLVLNYISRWDFWHDFKMKYKDWKKQRKYRMGNNEQ